MSIHNLRCDWCASVLAGPHDGRMGGRALGVRFTYHPGSAALRDDSGLLCQRCWGDLVDWLGDGSTPGACAACGRGVEAGYLAVGRSGELSGWVLCRGDAVEFLNRLRTVEPKLDPATFAFPAVAPGQDRPVPPAGA